MGHSSKVAEEHYLQVTSDHWSAGAKTLTGSQIGGPISTETGQSEAITENDEHGKTRVVIATDGCSRTVQHLQQDSNLQPAA